VELPIDTADFSPELHNTELKIALMHEQSIVESLLTLALDNAKKADARKIISIHLVVGDYIGIEEDAVNLYFGFLAKDTLAAGAGITYTHVSGQLRCRDCDVLFPLQKHDYRCPKCEGRRVEIVGGRELYIEDMKVT
jgi:hydrogenase nickel incorporation protein HypA/HybF